MRVVAYTRVSTGKQEASGLGLEAQLSYINQAAKAQGWIIEAVYTEAVSGTIAPTERPEMSKALSHGLPIVVAKLDRLSRDVEHIASLMKRVQIKVATMPQADNFQLHLFAALAQQEREFISQRTKDALQSLESRAKAGCVESVEKVKRRSVALSKGRAANNLQAANKVRMAGAEKAAKEMLVHLLQAMYNGCNTVTQVAQWLNSQGHTTPRGKAYCSVSARRLMNANNLSFK
ncbi:recombinase family protein [Pseudomonas sp. p1(2021b)]|uniref:recombinase family protein n=1 Tax=Pseudomonas sp. p1(2021b) TaxID=2874628 RepID=UPI003D26CDF0